MAARHQPLEIGHAVVAIAAALGVDDGVLTLSRATSSTIHGYRAVQSTPVMV